MHRGRLHSHNGAAAVAHKLVDDGLGIVEVTVFEPGKRAHGDDVTVARHHGDGFEQMLALVAVHDYATLGLQLPCAGIDVEYYHVHSQVRGCLLGREACAQTVVEEYHQQSLVLAQFLKGKAVALYLLCLGERLTEVAQVFYIEKCLHLFLPFLHTLIQIFSSL